MELNFGCEVVKDFQLAEGSLLTMGSAPAQLG